MPSTEGSKLEAGLYLVATPIGNLADITLRAIDILNRADLVACEDSRVTAKLLARHEIATPMQPYHDHNAARMRPRLLARIAAGQAVALVSDAGTPLVSDPGYKLVTDCREAGLAVTALPGPSAALAALAVSGLPSDRFLFAGFLATRTTARRRALAGLAGIDATLLIFESPRRLAAALADMTDILGDRPAAICRELTKRHEEVRRATLGELAAHYRDAATPKGEVTIVIAPPGETAARHIGEADIATGALDDRLGAAFGESGLRDAASRIAAETGLPRRLLYARLLELTGRR